MNGPVDRSRVDFLYYDGNPPYYDYYYDIDNEIQNIEVQRFNQRKFKLKCSLVSILIAHLLRRDDYQ